MPSQEDIAELQQLLETYRRTLSHYLQQHAALGSAHTPPSISHGIHEAREKIYHIKKTLRDWGINVEDHPTDSEHNFSLKFDSSDSGKIADAGRVCTSELSQWLDQIGQVLTYLRSRADLIDFREFDETLTQLHLQITAKSPIYLRDALIRQVIEQNCPNFERYAQSKGTLKLSMDDKTLSTLERQKIADFLKLCDKIESEAIKVKNPAWYGPGDPARKSILVEAVSKLNILRLKLNQALPTLYT